MSTTTEPVKTKKPWYKKWWVILIAVLVLVSVISSIINPPEKVAIADVSGMTAVVAKETLEGQGFRVSVKDADNKTVRLLDDYDAESTDPATGEEVNEGSTVTINAVEATERLAAAAEETARVEAEEAAAEEAERAEAEAQKTASVQEAEALWLSMHAIEDPIEFITMEGYENSLDNPLYAIQTGWGGSTDGYLEIKVQERLTEEGRKRLCIGILNFIGPEYPGIDGIVFNDSDGLDHNCFRSESPLASRS